MTRKIIVVNHEIFKTKGKKQFLRPTTTNHEQNIIFLCVRFAGVGLLGLCCQFLIFNALLSRIRGNFLLANSLGVFISTCCTFQINNELYGDKKLRKTDKKKGMIKYVLLSFIGIMINILVSWLSYKSINVAFIGQLTGILAGYIYTITITRRLIWRVGDSQT